MVVYAPGTQEKDPQKQNMALQEHARQIDVSTASIATLTTNAATYVVGPGAATANGFAVYSGTTGKLVKDHAATIDLTSEVSGALPVANGGTADTGTTWTTYTPTVTSGTGALTTVSATGRYKTIGKTVFIAVTVTITTNGTGATNIRATLPNTAASGTYVLSGRENAISGKMLQGLILPSVTVITLFNYDNTYPGANGASIVLSGVYEST